MDLQLRSGGKVTKIGLDMLVGNVSPAPSARNNFAYNESSFYADAYTLPIGFI